MKRWLWALLLVAVLPGLLYGGSIAISLIPPFNPSTDTGKVPVVQSNGTVAWSAVSGASGSVSGPAGSTNNDLVAFSGTGGHTLIDSNIPLANVVLVSRAVQAGTGLTVTNSGLLTADITMSFANATTSSVLGVTGATGPPTSIASSADGQVLRRASSVVGFGAISLSDATNAVSGVLPIGNGGTSGATAASGFANLSPLTAKGGLISYSTVPLQLAVGTTGKLLGADSTQTTGLGWTSQHVGTTTNDSAPTGYVGEYVASVVASAGAVTLSTGTAKTVTSISLTAGDWDVSAIVMINGTLTATYFGASIATADNTMSGATGDSEIYTPTASTASTDAGFSIASVRKSLSGTTTIYLVSVAAFSVGTAKSYGRISARRVR